MAAKMSRNVSIVIIVVLVTLLAPTNCDKSQVNGSHINNNLIVSKYIWPLKSVVQDVVRNVTVTLKGQMSSSCVESLIQLNSDLGHNRIYALKRELIHYVDTLCVI